MYYYTLDKMVCPKSKSHLKCEIFEEENIVDMSMLIGTVQKCGDYCACKGMNSENSGSEDCQKCQRMRITQGKLTGATGIQYPIINGVPRMLLPPYNQKLVEEYDGFFEKYGSHFNTLKKKSTTLDNNFDVSQNKTSESFGNEWEKFHSVLPEYRELFDGYFRSVDNQKLKDRPVLDAGCGMGRWSYFAAEKDATVYAVDFSRAVDMAYENLKKFRNAHVIQADIYNLPFKEEEFELVYSLGVLHHLPNPFEGFKNVAKMARQKGGGVLVYLYYALDNKSLIWQGILALVTALRMITTRLPQKILFPFCFVMSLFFQLFLVIPSKILGKLKLSGLVRKIPLHYYKDSSFKVVYNDTIDRFSAPIENRYTKKQIKEWYANAEINNCIIPDKRPYWSAYGER